jgi:hypothetical protein
MTCRLSFCVGVHNDGVWGVTNTGMLVLQDDYYTALRETCRARLVPNHKF